MITQKGKKIYTTDFYVDEIEFPSKKEGQAKYDDDRKDDALYQLNSDSDDLFTPIEDDSDIPF